MAKIDSAKTYSVNYKSCVESLVVGDLKRAVQWLNSALVHLGIAIDECNDDRKAVELGRIAAEYQGLRSQIEAQLKKPVAESAVSEECFKPVEVDKKDKEPRKAGINFDDVIGLDEVKDAVKSMIVYPFKYMNLYKTFNRSTGGGILLYGAPGTGKTMIAKAIANEIDAQFIAVSCSDIVSKWFGESQQNVRKLFEKARSKPRSIIFFDEFEALGGAREELDSSAKNAIVCELLAQISGFDSDKDCTIVVIAATNRPWDIDRALIRSGRFSKLLYVPLPDSETRTAILRKELSEVPQTTIDYEGIGAATEGYSSADVVEICNIAKDKAISRSIESGDIRSVTSEDLVAALAVRKPTVNAAELERLMNFAL